MYLSLARDLWHGLTLLAMWKWRAIYYITSERVEPGRTWKEDRAFALGNPRIYCAWVKRHDSVEFTASTLGCVVNVDPK